MTQFRTEKDPLGEKQVPVEALYGVQTLRALENFPISAMRPLEPFVLAQVWIKKAAALTHKETGRLERESGRRDRARRGRSDRAGSTATSSWWTCIRPVRERRTT